MPRVGPEGSELPIETGQPGVDREALIQFLAERPDCAAAWRRLGECEFRFGHRIAGIGAFERAAVEYAQRGATLRAVDTLKRLVLVAPDHAPAYVGLGNSVVALGLDEDAQRFFERAARVYLAAGNSDRAADVLRHALDLWPESAVLSQLLAGVLASVDARIDEISGAFADSVR